MPVGFWNLKKWSRESGEIKAVRVDGTEYWRERTAQKGIFRDLKEMSLQYSDKYSLVHACEDTTSNLGKSHLKVQ